MLIYYASLLGVAVFAVSGAIAAGRKGLDWVGVVALGVVTSLGGGTIRDVLLSDRLVFWIADPTYLWVATAASIMLVVYARFLTPPMNSLLIADALGLALFSIIGAQIAEDQGCAAIVVVLMGVLTGVAGGVVRDVLAGETPLLFRATEPLYSVAALSGVVVYLLLQVFTLDKVWAAVGGASVVALIRFAAIFWKIRLPAFRVSIDEAE